ncbi:hypothetical protein [Massilia violaceinigra]|uniref:hypothetical protein n=1 Tax=Massilia violaceinigra TaxID=2045208 RepID=UPI0012FDA494|nr:hypothetical protein [Massilia violaceinigra]
MQRALRTGACAVTLALMVLSTSGCFTAFTPKRDFCTHDPKDTAVPMCKPTTPP